MNRTYFAGGLAAILFATNALAASPSPGSAPVTVVNAASNPVPVTGTLGVSGSVTVGNSSANPIPVQGSVAVTSVPPGIEQFPQMNVISTGNNGSTGLITFTVSPAIPAGSLYVAKNLSLVVDSGNASYPIAGGSCRLVFKNAVSGDSTRIATVVGSSDPTFYQEWFVNQALNVVLKAGDSLDASCVFTFTSGHSSALFVSGYLGGHFQATE